MAFLKTCSQFNPRVAAVSLTAFAAMVGAPAQAQLLYQEGFNDDGEAANPKRYTMIGRDIYEVTRTQTELNNFDQKGPLWWDHNFKVSYAGNPNIPARRMILTWRGVDATTVTEDFLKLIDSSVAWLLNNKPNAKIVAFPNAAAMQGLADRLTSKGYTVVDDDIANFPDEQDVEGDLFIHAQGASNASRFVLSPKPVIVINSPDFDDMLVASIGTVTTFTPGDVTISAPGHPAAGGKTGSFSAFTADQTLELTGSFVAPGSTKLATVAHTVPPGINRLTDLDDAVAGNKQVDKTESPVSQIDFSDGSGGNWAFDTAIPGGYAGNFGLRVQGKLTVSKAGTFRFAVGSDDGARLQIDLNKNGFSASDTVLEDVGPHGHQIVYADVAFPTSGVYDFELRSYNSGGGGDVEVSVSNDVTPVPDDALDSGYWEVLGDPAGNSPVRLQGTATATSYKAVGPNVVVQEPLIVLLNGPNDTPPGEFFDGGPFTGFEGKGYIGGAGLNKWAYPVETGSYRALQLRPVNVAGKQNVKITVALAATGGDLETSDFMQLVIYPNGLGSTPVTLANFHGVVNAIQPWMADEKENFSRRLTHEFKDFTYDVPANATDLVVEMRVATTWWTEIAAFDNIRIHSGNLVVTKPSVAINRNGDNLVVTFTGVLQSLNSLNGTWADVQGNPPSPYTITKAAQGEAQFLRAR